MPIQCLDCHADYTMTEAEKVRFEGLMKTVAGFRMPRRCPSCRKIRRDQKPASAPLPMPKAAPVPAPVPAPPPAVVDQVDVRQKDPAEITLVLATKDFEDLVHGRPVVWHGVRVILADIGFTSMRKVIEEAELDRAKKLVKANNH